MDIELSRLRNKNSNTGYQKLESNEDGEPDSSGAANMSTSTRQARGYGNKKGKGKANKYVDEPEDEVDLLRGDEFADDEGHAEAGQTGHEMPNKVIAGLYYSPSVYVDLEIMYRHLHPSDPASKIQIRRTSPGLSHSDRQVHIGNPIGDFGTLMILIEKLQNKYPANVVRNQKYNVFTFFPIVFYEQFKFFFNLYFLLVALSQFIPALKIGTLSASFVLP
jgi:phospholipid-translocating ATPase